MGERAGASGVGHLYAAYMTTTGCLEIAHRMDMAKEIHRSSMAQLGGK